MPRPRRKTSAKKRSDKSVPRKRAPDSRARELEEALEQQAATAEVLKAISSPAFDLQRVLDSMTRSAAGLCKASDSTILLLDGDAMVFGSHFGQIPVDFTSWRVSRNWTGGRAVLDRKTVHVRDMQSETKDFPEGNVASARMGYRTILTVPMMHGDKPIGALTLRRTEVRSFNAKQVALAESFATQAVIAIENTRLVNEVRESLERQTATSDVLDVISRSPGALEPVFKAMLESATRICGARFGVLYLFDGAFSPAALVNAPAAYAEFVRKRGRFLPQAGNALDRLRETKRTVYSIDEAAEPIPTNSAKLAGARSQFIVPMLKNDELVGAIAIYRQEVRPFTDKQIGLVHNFASQAVIAIENARLLNALRDRTNELRQLNGQLEKRVSDQVAEIGRMSRLRRFLPPQVADLIVSSGRERELESHRREITALFCDLRGFTAFAESADPEDVMKLLRAYHAAIGKIIFKHGGTLERFVGDGAMVIFNDPIPLEKPSLHAVQMALEMRASIGALAENWRRLGHEIGFGIGIAHGYATLGTIGFEGRFDYAAVGTVSNVASRLCDEAKPGQILISSRVLTEVKDAVTVEPAGELMLKGIRRPVEVYNVIDASDAAEAIG